MRPFPGLLALALEAWYLRASPRNPKARAFAVARDFGVSPSLLYRYSQLDFARRCESD